MDEDHEVIKDNEDNGNKLNISNKKAELSYTVLLLDEENWSSARGTGWAYEATG